MGRDASSTTEPFPGLRRAALALGVFAILVAVSASVVLGRMHGAPTLLAFFGRFHPLLVHLPIGMFVLVVLAETATLQPRLRQRIDPVLGLALPVTVLGALAAFVLGHFLALTGDYPEHVLGWHRRLELFAVVGAALALIAWELQDLRSFAHGRTLYRGLLGASVGLLSIGAHFGGTITHGETYLTAFAPAPLQALLGAPPKPKEAAKTPEIAAEPTVFEASVQPVLNRYCGDCHSEKKASGKLRLDSLAAIVKGGDSGAAIVPGSAANSELMKRLLAIPSDDDHMPPANKPQPSAEEITLVGFWIDRGATPTLRVRDALPPTPTRALLEKALGPQAASLAPTATVTATPGATPAKAPDAAAAATSSASSLSSVASSGSSEVDAKTHAASTSGGGSLAPLSILNRRCGNCHGPNVQRSGLRVDSLAGLEHGGDDGPAIVPGNPAQSRFLQRIRLPLSDDDHMPPSDEPQLTPSELSALSSWVKNGAGSAAKTALASTNATSMTATSEASGAGSAAPTAATASPSAPPLAASAPPISSTPASTQVAAPPTAGSPASGAAEPSAEAHPEEHAVVHGSGCAACTLGEPVNRGEGRKAALGAGLCLFAMLVRRGRRRRADLSAGSTPDERSRARR